MRPNLQVLTLNELVEDREDLRDRLAFVLTFSSQGKVHEQSCRIFKRVVGKLIDLISDGFDYPFYDVILDHLVLGLLSEGELLKSTQSVLPQIAVLLAFTINGGD